MLRWVGVDGVELNGGVGWLGWGGMGLDRIGECCPLAIAQLFLFCHSTAFLSCFPAQLIVGVDAHMPNGMRAFLSQYTRVDLDSASVDGLWACLSAGCAL